MPKKQGEAPRLASAERARRVCGGLLLVPEAPLILLLLGVYWVAGAPAWLSVAITLLIIGFIARLLALLSARLAYDSAHYGEAGVLASVALALNPWSADTLSGRRR